MAEYPSGPNGMAWRCEDTLAELTAERDALPQDQRKRINKRIKLTRDMLKWARSRAGFDASAKRPGT